MTKLKDLYVHARKRLQALRPPSPTWSRGWRLTAILACMATFGVFILNLVLLLWFFTAAPTTDGVKALYQGSCKQTAKLATFIHLFINMFATILVAGSNFCMQQLCAPTRSDVNRAHQKRQWLDIGVQSLRNLSKISKTRSILWILLALSSCPLHLLYNSAVYEQRATYDGNLFIIEPGRGTNWTMIDHTYFAASQSKDILESYRSNTTGDMSFLPLWETELRYVEMEWSKMELRDMTDCEDALDVMGSRRSLKRRLTAADKLLSVRSERNASVQFSRFGSECDAVCESQGNCGEPRLDCRGIERLSDTSWQTDTSQIDFSLYFLECRDQIKPERCRLRVSLSILIVVVIANAVKVICMLLTILDGAPTLTTVGDFIQSVLSLPDIHVPNAIVSGQVHPLGLNKKARKLTDQVRKQRHSSHWQKKLRWPHKSFCFCKFISVRQCLVTEGFLFVCCLGCITGIILMVVYPWTDLKFKPDDAMIYPYSANLAPWLGNNVLQNALCANLPQLVLTQLYMAYNNLFTRKAVALEWDEMATKTSPLRVTDPHGSQHSTHYLGLPFKIAIPLQIVSILMHWLTSQTLFVTSFVVFDYKNEPVMLNEAGWSLTSTQFSQDSGDYKNKSAQLVTRQFSCSALITFVGLAIICLIVSIIDDFRMIKPHMPRVKTCSAAIAASCGKKSLTDNQIQGELRWGIMKSTNGLVECGFTDEVKRVAQPEEGDMLARYFLCWNTREWQVGKVPQKMLTDEFWPPEPEEPRLNILSRKTWENLRDSKRGRTNGIV